MEKKIFFACPIGADNSESRQRSDRVLKHIINPVINELTVDAQKFNVIRADKMATPGRITEQIIKEIKESDVFIADLSESNPNVMYELGIRQAMMKPYILMAESGHKLPFDLSDLRTIFYKLDLDNVEKSQEELRNHLERAINGEISLIDKQFFADIQEYRTDTANMQAPSASFEILEACQKILEEVGNVRELLLQVGGVTLEIREKERREIELRKEQHNHELGMALFSQILQNPDSMDKILPLMQSFSEFGKQS